MTNEYIYVTGQDGAIYEVCPTDALLDFLQRLAEGENAEPATDEQPLSCQEQTYSQAH
ncbi:MAG TPA: hypothetical protein VH164_10685 [Ktedonobacteraceae bacterium]|jgi:hypothetical protein|nr:hypothetical protein [Ktedonobacteraceae bacterium]